MAAPQERAKRIKTESTARIAKSKRARKLSQHASKHVKAENTRKKKKKHSHNPAPGADTHFTKRSVTPTHPPPPPIARSSPGMDHGPLPLRPFFLLQFQAIFQFQPKRRVVVGFSSKRLDFFYILQLLGNILNGWIFSTAGSYSAVGLGSTVGYQSTGGLSSTVK